jgi:hypothetical protein
MPSRIASIGKPGITITALVVLVIVIGCTLLEVSKLVVVTVTVVAVTEDSIEYDVT